MNKDDLKLRETLKRRKPEFIRQQISLAKLRRRWKKPRGKHSKIRLVIKGHRVMPSIGYGMAKRVKNLHKLGLRSRIIRSINEIDNLNPKTDGIIIASSIGVRKRVEILKKIKSKGFVVFNVKDIDKFLKNIEEKLAKNKEKQKERVKRKEKSKKEAEKKVEEKKEEEKKELTEEEKEAKEKEAKEEKRKLLEQRT